MTLLYVMNVEPNVPKSTAIELMRFMRAVINDTDGAKIHHDLTSIHMLSFSVRDMQALTQVYNKADNRIYMRRVSRHHGPSPSMQ